MIIFDPALEESVLQAQVDRYSEIVRSRGATVGRVERWGRRRLAYELHHHRDGYYVVMEATAEPPAMAELERSLFLADEVLRHKVIRIPDRVAGRQRSSPPPADEASAPPPPPIGGDAPAPGDAVAAGEAAADTSMSTNGA
ncbi:MAG: 30S ribosomal protein S6 [Actinomycetota bacterium]|nr:30S ribosomal protein S6 [Actinomycetota bacterium]